MPWTVSVSDDAETTGEQTLSATWTDPNPLYGVFTFTKRIIPEYSHYTQYKTLAIAARNAWQARKQELIDIEDWVLDMTNTADIQVPKP